MPRRNIFPRLKGELENRIHQLSPGDMLPGAVSYTHLTLPTN